LKEKSSEGGEGGRQREMCEEEEGGEERKKMHVKGTREGKLPNANRRDP